MNAITLLPLQGLPLFQPGDDLAGVLGDALERGNIRVHGTDILVVTQKVVSKVEGRLRELASVIVSDVARALAARVRKDPRLVELVLQESKAVVRAEPDVLIVEHRSGCIMANAGIDQSNVGPEGHEYALLLPDDCDASCAALRSGLERRFGVAIGVLINDSFGRPWRNGVTGVCLGAAGIPALVDRRGAPDLFARALRTTEIATGDEIAAAASLLMGQADEAVPAVLVRGFQSGAPQTPASLLIRAQHRELFR